MKEPVYECQVCGTTLERWEQGKYTWCKRCREIWGRGFDDGIRYAEAVKNVKGTMELIYLMDRVAPYYER